MSGSCFSFTYVQIFFRSLLESSTETWSPHLACDVDAIERVQRRFVKRVPGLLALPHYLGRLAACDFEPLSLRRLRADLRFVYKMFTGLVDFPIDRLFVVAPPSALPC